MLVQCHEIGKEHTQEVAIRPEASRDRCLPVGDSSGVVEPLAMADSREGSRASRSRVAHAPKSASKMCPSSATSMFAAFKSLHDKGTVPVNHIDVGGTGMLCTPIAALHSTKQR